MPNQHPKQVKTLQELSAGITPMIPGQPERIPWSWFDTQTYTSGTTTTLAFFQTVNADKTLSNMVAAGQIPSPMFYDLYHCSIAYLLPVSALTLQAAASGNGAMNDVRLLSNGGVTLNIANKDYFQGPQICLPAGGGPFGDVSAVGTFAAPLFSTVQNGNNGNPDLRNRYNFWGDITIPHNQNFLWQLSWSVPLTLQGGNTGIKVWMDGYLYRRVL